MGKNEKTPNSDIYFSDELPYENTINFSVEDKEVLRITEDGFIYKGELIEDAGEAHRVFIKVMNQMEQANV